MSVSCIAEDPSAPSASNNICDNKHAVNSELCGETLSTADFFQRCIDDPRYCSPGDWGYVQKVAQDTTTEDTVVAAEVVEDTDDEADAVVEVIPTVVPTVVSKPVSSTVSDVAGNKSLDATFAMKLAMLQGLLQKGDLSAKELKDTAFWEAFWTDSKDNFWEQFWKVVDDGILSARDEILADNAIPTSNGFWLVFGEFNIGSILEFRGNYINTTLADGTNELVAYRAAYDAGMDAAEAMDFTDVDWTDPNAAVREISDAAYEASGDLNIARAATLDLLQTLYQKGTCASGATNIIMWRTGAISCGEFGLN
jgi:hypothetical protein